MGAAVDKPLILLRGKSMKVERFETEMPGLEIDEYFDGKTMAWGVFEDRFGNLRRQFTVDIEGSCDDGCLKLDETFLYSDGEREKRTWKLRKTGERSWQGQADDVVGIAVGEAGGNAFHLKYRMDLKMKKRTLRVSFDDWMFLQPSGVLLSRTKVRKFGLALGTVILFFKKPAEPALAN